MTTFQVDDWTMMELPVGSDVAEVDFPRTLLLAFQRGQTYPIATMTLIPAGTFEHYGDATKVDMVHVHDLYRRQGVATRLWWIAEARYGRLVGEGVTDEGEAFCEAVGVRRPFA